MHDDKVNLLFILVDQQRYDSLGFTGRGLVKTPNLDRLASSGVSFSRAFTPCPLCCPARQSLLTSTMPHEHGGHWNYGICSSVSALSPEALPHWPGALAADGYHTIYAGKWHVNPEQDPRQFGYDQYIPEIPYDQNRLKPYDEQAERPLVRTPADLFSSGLYDTSLLEETPTHRLAGQVIKFIEQEAALGHPWHARLDFPEPHLPCYPVRQFLQMYPAESILPWENYPDPFTAKPEIQKRQLKNWGIDHWSWDDWSVYLRHYFAMISQIDDAIGMVLGALERLDLLEQTLVIFTSDHGDAAGSHGMIDKHYVMYEEEVHVPLIISRKGTIAPGKAESFVIHALDLGPTVLDLLGLPIPGTFRGRSLVPLLDDPAIDHRDFVISEYNGQQFGLYTQRMIRDSRYTYVWNPTSIDELYDHDADPAELKNVAGDAAYAEVLQYLKDQLYHEFSASGDMMVQNAWSAYQLTGRLPEEVQE
jgi:arylsulfatase A-like enzyme